MSALAIPAVTDSDSLQESAEWYAANLRAIQEFESAVYKIKRRINEVIKDTGPILTAVGKLAIEPNGYDYPEEIAQEFPTLGKHTITATVETLEQAERLLDLVMEQDPKAEVGHSMKVDGRLANSWLKTADPSSAMRLMELRKPKGRLTVR